MMFQSWLRVFGLLATFQVAVCAQAMPAVPVPPENPITEAKRVLGKILFWEEQLSSDNTMACGTCHFPEAGGGEARIGDPNFPNPLNINPGGDGLVGTADDILGGRGVVACNPDGTFRDDGTFWPNPQVTGRKTPPAIGAQWDTETFWDGRAASAFYDPDNPTELLIAAGGALENQAMGPPVSDVEMGCMNRGHGDFAAKIAAARPWRLAVPGSFPSDAAAVLTPGVTYPDLFNAAFGSPDVTAGRIAMAIATYERTLIPDQTPYDAWFSGSDPNALNAAAQAGFLHFTTTTANCHLCHNHTSGLFTDGTFRNIGVRPDTEDEGRKDVTNDPADIAKFKVPHLRNIALRAPYFHNGGKATLAEVLVSYEIGGDFPGPHLDTDLVPLNIGQQERFELEQFLLSLTDPRVANATFPFDRPTLRSEANPNPALLPSPGTAGLGGFVPAMVAPIPPMIGSDHFGVGLAYGRPASPAVIVFSIPGPPAPLAGGTFWPSQNPSLHLAVPLTLSGAPTDPDGSGMGSFMVPIPDDPFFDSLTFWAQWAVIDPAGVSSLALSNPAQFTFMLP